MLKDLKTHPACKNTAKTIPKFAFEHQPNPK